MSSFGNMEFKDNETIIINKHKDAKLNIIIKQENKKDKVLQTDNFRSESLKKAQQKYYQKIKDNPEYIKKRREYQYQYYLKNRENPEFRKRINEASLRYYYKKKEKNNGTS